MANYDYVMARMLHFYISSPSLAVAGEHGTCHGRHTHKPQAVSNWLNPHSSLKFKLFKKLPGNCYIDLNLSSLKWCSVINCNWCVSLDIAYILA